MREIQDSYTDGRWPRIVFKKSAQVGASEFINNVIGYHVHQDPWPILLFQPTLDLAKRYAKTRIAPMLDESPELARLVARKSRDSSDTILHKDYPGGTLIIGGANSAASLQSQPAPIILADEFSQWDLDVGGQGDPGDIAEARSLTFWNRRFVAAGTPTNKGVCRVDREYQSSTRDRFFVPCHSCGFMQKLGWGGIKFDWKDAEHQSIDYDSVRYECEQCQEAWLHEVHKMEFLRAGEWRSEDPAALTRGFWINTVYSPFVSFVQIVKAWERARGFEGRMKSFTNLWLGECFETKGETVEQSALAARRSAYGAEVPDKVIRLTCGVDIQQSPARIELEVVGWGEGLESWNIDYQVIYGETSDWRKGAFKDLPKYLMRTYRRADKTDLSIDFTFVDSGHQAQEVYKFCHQMRASRVFPSKGATKHDAELYKRAKSKTNIGTPGKNVWLFHIGQHQAKKNIYSALNLKDQGPGFCHFPKERDEDYFSQLTAEELRTKKRQGHDIEFWYLPDGKRNEVLDCRVLAYAAVKASGPLDDIRKAEPAGPVQQEPNRAEAYQNWIKGRRGRG